jgi:hypothetical protein
VVSSAGKSVIEYRISTSGGHTHLYGRTDRRLKPTPYANPRAESEPLPAPASPAAAPEHAEDQREIATVGIADKIKAAFEQHGPMTSRELASSASSAARAAASSTACRRRRSPIARSPPRRAPESAAAPKKAKKRAVSSPRKAGSKAAKKAWKTRRANKKRQPKTSVNGATKKLPPFRTALAADGAILFMGAKKGDFEIPRTEARAWSNLVRRLNEDELAAAVDFIDRLDAAQVAA